MKTERFGVELFIPLKKTQEKPLNLTKPIPTRPENMFSYGKPVAQ